MENQKGKGTAARRNSACRIRNGMPPIVVASIVGVLLSLIQAITQLQEQTLTFGVKLIAVVVTLFVMGSWLGAELLRYANEIFNRFYML